MRNPLKFLPYRLPPLPATIAPFYTLATAFKSILLFLLLYLMLLASPSFSYHPQSYLSALLNFIVVVPFSTRARIALRLP